MKRDTVFRIKLLVSSVILLLLALAFNATQNISAFKNLFLNSLSSHYQVVGRGLLKKVPVTALPDLSQADFAEVNSIIEEFSRNQSGLQNILVALPDGKVVYSLDPVQRGKPLPAHLRVGFEKGKGTSLGDSTSQRLTVDGEHYVFLPAGDEAGNWTGTLYLSFGDEVLQNKMRDVFLWNLKTIGGTTCLAAVVLAVCLAFLISVSQSSRFPLVRLYLILFIVLGSAQILYSALTIQFLKEGYAETNRDKSTRLAYFLSREREHLVKPPSAPPPDPAPAKKHPKADIRIRELEIIGPGWVVSQAFPIPRDTPADPPPQPSAPSAREILLHRMAGIELLNEVVQASPEIEVIRVLDKDKKVVYASTISGGKNSAQEKLYEKSKVTEAPSDDENEMLFPVLKGKSLEGYIRISLQRGKNDEKIRETIWDSLTVVVISILFMVELVIILMVLIYKKMDLVSQQQTEIDDSGMYGLIRPVAFLFLFSMDLSVSFIPLYMGSLYQPFFGLSKNMAMGLPISMEMAFAAIATILSGAWIDKRGWHYPFMTGILLAAFGNLLSGSATSPLQFILSRGVTGLGYGLCFMSCQGFVLVNTSSMKRARGMSNLTAGIIVGSVCGGAAGAMLAERVGYGPVFYATAGLLLLVLLFIFLFMRDTFIRPVVRIRAQQERLTLTQVKRFALDRNIFSLITLNSVPAALCLWGFLYYLTPVYLNGIGASRSDIGRVLMIYGFCQIYFSPYISRLVDRSDNKKRFIAVSGLLTGLGYVAFGFYGGFGSIVMVILLLGISNSFGNSSRVVFALNQKTTQELGESQSISIYRFSERIGQVLGPLTFGWLMMLYDLTSSMQIIGTVVLISTFLFIGIAKHERRERLSQDDIDNLVEDYQDKCLSQDEVDTLISKVG